MSRNRKKQGVLASLTVTKGRSKRHPKNSKENDLFERFMEEQELIPRKRRRYPKAQ